MKAMKRNKFNQLRRCDTITPQAVRGETEGIFRVEGFEISPRLREVRRGGVLVYLRPKAFDLLVYLLTPRERVLTKEELLAALWPDATVTGNSLAQCVIELRKALGDDARQPKLIQTVAKSGYRFIGKIDPDPVVESASPIAGTVPRREPGRPWLWAAAAAVILAVVAFLPTLPRLSAPGPARAGEVAWWSFDESGATVQEIVHGSIARLGPGVWRVPGRSGSALSFRGNDAAVHGHGIAGLPRGQQPRTLMAWIRTGSTAADSTAIFHYGGSVPNGRADAFYLALHLDGRAAFANYFYSSILSRDRVDDGRWHHLAGVFDGESRRGRLFVDGVLQSEGRIEGPKQASAVSDWSVGRFNWGGTTFRGEVDDVRLYERPLGAAEIQSLHRCTSGTADLRTDQGRVYYFASIHGSKNVEFLPTPDGESSARFRSPEGEYGGVTLVEAPPGCPVANLRAADVGQDLAIDVELRLRTGPEGEITEGGPFFRSRAAAPGDGIVGGTSAGYWVLLLSTGQVRVRRLHPAAVVAFSERSARFDPGEFHKLTATVRGESIEVVLDGERVLFDVGGVKTHRVPAPPAWEKASPPGTNRGSAGVAFASEPFRNRIGGHEARNIRLRR
jgi:DNA-binding winged helix-turn-helix (wHTH) protein